MDPSCCRFKRSPTRLSYLVYPPLKRGTEEWLTTTGRESLILMKITHVQGGTIRARSATVHRVVVGEGALLLKGAYVRLPKGGS